MALAKFHTALTDEFPDHTKVTCAEVFEYIGKYVEQEKQQYLQDRKDRKITWGKWKGHTIAELAATEPGKDYLRWTLSQSWLDPQKFQWFYEDCATAGVQKK